MAYLLFLNPELSQICVNVLINSRRPFFRSWIDVSIGERFLLFKHIDSYVIDLESFFQIHSEMS